MTIVNFLINSRGRSLFDGPEGCDAVDGHKALIHRCVADSLFHLAI